MTAQVEAVVFDYGGVLTTPMRGSIRAWQSAEGIDPSTFTNTLRAWLGRNAPRGTPLHRLETGELDTDEFDVLLAAELRTLDGGPVVAEGLLSRLFAGTEQEQASWQLVRDLKTAGVRVALLSNSWGNRYPREEIDALFDPVVISGEIGQRKPDAAIFELLLDKLGTAPGAAVLVDDAEPNILGAEAVGMRGILHADPATTRRALAALVPGLDPEPLPHRSDQ
ncbi:HAD family hydrolase [Nocardioides insulae]|uniref:HAD family hydrolase n=1 Tax=Nocardioides insulae TaxID=394734 RepID=UPI00042A0AEA|nr:HAD family phosphatase [Nocardioides insulae]